MPSKCIRIFSRGGGSAVVKRKKLIKRGKGPLKTSFWVLNSKNFRGGPSFLRGREEEYKYGLYEIFNKVFDFSSENFGQIYNCCPYYLGYQRDRTIMKICKFSLFMLRTIFLFTQKSSRPPSQFERFNIFKTLENTILVIFFQNKKKT